MHSPGKLLIASNFSDQIDFLRIGRRNEFVPPRVDLLAIHANAGRCGDAEPKLGRPSTPRP